MKQYRIEVNIVDDHLMFCEGLTEAINHTPVARVTHTFDTFEACRQAFTEHRPDVLLLDISIPDSSLTSSLSPVKNGIKFCEEIIAAYPKLKVIAITIHDEYSVIKKMLDCGVHGYVLKSSPLSELMEAIQQVWRGERYISRQVSDIIQESAEQNVILTQVESNILKYICEGYTNPEIGHELCLSTETVNWYRKRLLAKYSAKNSVSLVMLVLKEKLL